MNRRTKDRLLNQVAEQVVSRTGLYFPPERRKELERGLMGVASELNGGDLESSLQWMSTGAWTQNQLETLISHLTVGETYFFRDQKTVDLLRHDILPALIDSHKSSRQLRMWIAGCCTGEEAYTMAILLAELVPDLDEWNINLLATDLNPRFLAKAAAGLYGEWSFRETPPSVRNRYFTKTVEGTNELCPQIRNMVSFAPLNLAQDAISSVGIGSGSMDLISCRNVLMYLHPAHLKMMSQQFLLSLKETGWLIVSPNDGIQEFASSFTAVRYCGSIAYQKKSHVREKQPRIPEALTVVHPETRADDKLDFVLDDAIANGNSNDLNNERTVVKPALKTVAAPEDAQFIQSMARAYADRGSLDEALVWCDLAVAEGRTDPSAHYLRATILQEQGSLTEATSSLHTVLYLDPTFVLAHVTLAFVALQLKQQDASEKHLAYAKGLLAGYSPDLVLPLAGGITAGKLSELIQNANAGKAAQ